jgi:hypothetical protein
MTRPNSAAPAPRTALRCAIYTRKSTEEGLKQEFNSLDAQRESASAEVATEYATRIAAAETAGELRQVGERLTPEVKGQLVLKDLERVRALYAKRLAAFKGQPAGVGDNGPP